MNIGDFYIFLINILRSEPEVIASFFMGGFLTVMLAVSLRRWMSPGREAGVEVIRRDAEIARRDTELARKDARIAVLESRLTNLEGRLSGEGKHATILRRQDKVSATSSSPTSDSLTEQYEAMKASCAKLKDENLQLQQDRRSIEADAEILRTKLAQASDEAVHWAKWWKVLDEENARLAETGSPLKG